MSIARPLAVLSFLSCTILVACSGGSDPAEPRPPEPTTATPTPTPRDLRAPGKDQLDDGGYHLKQPQEEGRLLKTGGIWVETKEVEGEEITTEHYVEVVTAIANKGYAPHKPFELLGTPETRIEPFDSLPNPPKDLASFQTIIAKGAIKFKVRAGTVSTPAAPPQALGEAAGAFVLRQKLRGTAGDPKIVGWLWVEHESTGLKRRFEHWLLLTEVGKLKPADDYTPYETPKPAVDLYDTRLILLEEPDTLQEFNEAFHNDADGDGKHDVNESEVDYRLTTVER